MEIKDAENKQHVSGWSVRYYKNDNGEDKIQIYKEKFSGILTLDFGKSHKYNEPVLNLIKSRLPVSIQFGIISLILTYTFCVYLGIQKAIKHGSPFDFASSAIVFVGYSIPGWALEAVMLVAFGGGSGIGLFPLGGFQSPDYDQLTLLSKIGDRAYYFVLPTIAYCIAAFATTTMLMKTVRSGKINPKKLITHHFTLDEALKAYGTFGNAGKEKTLKVIISNS